MTRLFTVCKHCFAADGMQKQNLTCLGHGLCGSSCLSLVRTLHLTAAAACTAGAVHVTGQAKHNLCYVYDLKLLLLPAAAAVRS
jgi:hypothetical protein